MTTKNYFYLFTFLFFGLSTHKAAAQYSFISTTLEYSGYDSLNYRLGISHYHGPHSYDSLTVKSFFGDGTSSVVTALSGTPRAYVSHHYTTPGVYTVRCVLI